MKNLKQVCLGGLDLMHVGESEGGKMSLVRTYGYSV